MSNVVVMETLLPDAERQILLELVTDAFLRIRAGRAVKRAAVLHGLMVKLGGVDTRVFVDRAAGVPTQEASS